MKRSPDMQRLEEMLRSSKFAMGGFIGNRVSLYDFNHETFIENGGLITGVNARFDIVSIVKDDAGTLIVEKHARRAFEAPRRSY